MIKIKDKDVEKLPQLDRIELMLKARNIKEHYKYGEHSSFFNFMMLSCIFLLLIYILNPILIIIYLIKFIVSFMILLLFFNIFIREYLTYKKNKEMKKLLEEYFKIENRKKVNKK